MQSFSFIPLMTSEKKILNIFCENLTFWLPWHGNQSKSTRWTNKFIWFVEDYSRNISVNFHILTSSPTLRHVTWCQKLWNGSRPSKVLIFERRILSDDCDIDISLLMKNSKSVTLTSRSGGDGILDQYLTSGIVSTRSIQRFKRYPILKTFNQKLKHKI